MALHLRTAGWKQFHLAGVPRRRLATGLLAAGAGAFVIGGSIIALSLAPMFGLGPNSVTVPVPAQAAGPPEVDGSTVNLIAGLANNTSQSAINLVDRPINGVAFEMSIPALGYKSTVYEGVDSKTLLKGPGHYPTTAWPGHPGNVGVAAHNVYWIAFNRLKVGDKVEITTRRGLFVYEITGTRIVDPSDAHILDSTDAHQLTLTTCWPLWAGAYATQRLIFFAKEIGGVA